MLGAASFYTSGIVRSQKVGVQDQNEVMWLRVGVKLSTLFLTILLHFELWVALMVRSCANFAENHLQYCFCYYIAGCLHWFVWFLSIVDWYCAGLLSSLACFEDF